MRLKNSLNTLIKRVFLNLIDQLDLQEQIKIPKFEFSILTLPSMVWNIHEIILLNLERANKQTEEFNYRFSNISSW